MRNNNIVIRFIFILVISIGSIKKSCSQDVPKLLIDPSMANGGIVSDYFNCIEYIPLETTKESLFGAIDQLIVTDSSFVINDWDTKSILFFSLKGKFIVKIKHSETLQLNLSYDAHKKIIYVSAYNPLTRKTKTVYYNSMGQLLPNMTGELGSGMVSDLIAIGNDYFVEQKNYHLIKGVAPKDSMQYFVTIYKNTTAYKYLFPCNQQEQMGLCSIQGYFRKIKIVENESFFISTPLDHNLYWVNKDTAKKIYQFVFPVNRSFPVGLSKSSNRHYIDSIRNSLDFDHNKIMDVSNIFFNGSRLFFKINTRIYFSSQGSEISNQYNFIFDTISHKLVSVERISSDSSCFYLPITDNSIKINGFDYFNKCFYTSLSSFKMFSEMERTKSKNPQYPPVLQQYFKSQNRKSNPIIVKMKLKE